MKNKEFQETIELLADKAKMAEYNDLAIVLYTYLGSEKAGVSSDFSRHCQKFAKEMSGRIDLFENRRNN
jgi:hypothetical protein